MPFGYYIQQQPTMQSPAQMPQIGPHTPASPPVMFSPGFYQMQPGLAQFGSMPERANQQQQQQQLMQSIPAHAQHPLYAMGFQQQAPNQQLQQQRMDMSAMMHQSPNVEHHHQGIRMPSSGSPQQMMMNQSPQPMMAMSPLPPSAGLMPQRSPLVMRPMSMSPPSPPFPPTHTMQQHQQTQQPMDQQQLMEALMQQMGQQMQAMGILSPPPLMYKGEEGGDDPMPDAPHAHHGRLESPPHIPRRKHHQLSASMPRKMPSEEDEEKKNTIDDMCSPTNNRLVIWSDGTIAPPPTPMDHVQSSPPGTMNPTYYPQTPPPAQEVSYMLPPTSSQPLAQGHYFCPNYPMMGINSSTANPPTADGFLPQQLLMSSPMNMSEMKTKKQNAGGEWRYGIGTENGNFQYNMMDMLRDRLDHSRMQRHPHHHDHRAAAANYYGDLGGDIEMTPMNNPMEYNEVVPAAAGTDAEAEEEADNMGKEGNYEGYRVKRTFIEVEMPSQDPRLNRSSVPESECATNMALRQSTEEKMWAHHHSMMRRNKFMAQKKGEEGETEVKDGEMFSTCVELPEAQEFEVLRAPSKVEHPHTGATHMVGIPTRDKSGGGTIEETIEDNSKDTKPLSRRERLREAQQAAGETLLERMAKTNESFFENLKTRNSNNGTSDKVNIYHNQQQCHPNDAVTVMHMQPTPTPTFPLLPVRGAWSKPLQMNAKVMSNHYDQAQAQAHGGMMSNNAQEDNMMVQNSSKRGTSSVSELLGFKDKKSTMMADNHMASDPNTNVTKSGMMATTIVLEDRISMPTFNDAMMKQFDAHAVKMLDKLDARGFSGPHSKDTFEGFRPSDDNMFPEMEKMVDDVVGEKGNGEFISRKDWRIRRFGAVSEKTPSPVGARLGRDAKPVGQPESPPKEEYHEKAKKSKKSGKKRNTLLKHTVDVTHLSSKQVGVLIGKKGHNARILLALKGANMWISPADELLGKRILEVTCKDSVKHAEAVKLVEPLLRAVEENASSVSFPAELLAQLEAQVSPSGKKNFVLAKS